MKAVQSREKRDIELMKDYDPLNDEEKSDGIGRGNRSSRSKHDSNTSMIFGDNKKKDVVELYRSNNEKKQRMLQLGHDGLQSGQKEYPVGDYRRNSQVERDQQRMKDQIKFYDVEGMQETLQRENQQLKEHVKALYQQLGKPSHTQSMS